MANKILVVDDEEKIRLIIKKYAEFEGYDISEAADGMEAIEKCKNEDFDLIILADFFYKDNRFDICFVSYAWYALRL